MWKGMEGGHVDKTGWENKCEKKVRNGVVRRLRSMEQIKHLCI
jgi:hypothetical protein